MTTVARAMIEPTDRSMPAATMTMVMPRAAVQTIAVWRAISSRLTGRKNCGPMSRAKTAQTKRRPSSGRPAAQEVACLHAASPVPVAAIMRRVLVPLRRRPRRAQPPAAHHGDAVAQAEQLGQVAAGHEHRLGRARLRPAGGRDQPVHQRVDLGLAARRRCRAWARRGAGRPRRDGAAGPARPSAGCRPRARARAGAGPAARTPSALDPAAGRGVEARGEDERARSEAARAATARGCRPRGGRGPGLRPCGPR